jgi:hypothetical protein
MLDTKISSLSICLFVDEEIQKKPQLPFTFCLTRNTNVFLRRIQVKQKITSFSILSTFQAMETLFHHGNKCHGNNLIETLFRHGNKYPNNGISISFRSVPLHFILLRSA